jgi:two-component system OmpR family response regulator
MGRARDAADAAASRADVLVVDDHPGIRDLVRDVLTAAGYGVRAAADGAAALRLATAAPPAVILLDVQMPGLDGPAFVAAYRRAPGPHAPVVVMTAADAPGWAARLRAAGHLGKPFGVDPLLAAVRRFGGRPAPGAA